MEIAHLKYFYFVAKHKSVTRAALALKVSQPAVSRMIKQLEWEEDIKLFDRRGKELILTDLGKFYFERCEIIFQEVAELETASLTSKNILPAFLRIGAADNVGNYLLPQVVGPMMAKGEQELAIKLRTMTSSHIKKQLLEKNLDIGIFSTPLFPEEKRTLRSFDLGAVEFALIVPRSYRGPLKFATAKSGGYLDHLIFVGPRKEDLRKAHRNVRFYQQLGLTPRHFIDCNGQETQKKFVLEGQSYAIVTKFLVANELKTGRLKEMQLPHVISAPIYWVTRADYSENGKELALKSLLQNFIVSL